METSDGSIIAAIITIHMPTNDAAAPGHVWPGIRIHTIDIVQPPCIGMPPMTPSRHGVLVVMTPPYAFFVASLRRAVEPLVHAPESVQSARKRGIRVVDDAVVEHERAHARPLARVGGR